MGRFEHADAALAYAEDLMAVTDFVGFSAVTKKAFAKFGFSNFVIAEFPLPGDNLRDVILLKKLPGGWLELYARRRQTPFDWADAPYNKETDLRAHEIMCLASDFGMASGYCVPARLLQRDMCVSSSGGQVELTRHTNLRFTLWRFMRSTGRPNWLGRGEWKRSAC